MPTPEWNRRWASKMQAQEASQNLPYYGVHWGNPDPAALFPPVLRAWLPERLMALLLRSSRLRRWLKNRTHSNTGYNPNLYVVLTRYLRPFVNAQTRALEIGPGGGRWTQHMLHAQHLTLVDLNPEFFDYLRARFPEQVARLHFYQTRDYEMEGIASASVNFVFSFGTFVHIDPEGIQAYLSEIARVLTPGGHATLQYADKTKLPAKNNKAFSEMNGALMERFVAALPSLQIIEHQTQLMSHSNVIVLRKSSTTP